VTLLLIRMTYHDTFYLISLEGVFIVFAGPCLVDSFGGTSLAWDSLGYESYRMDTMACTLDDDDNLLRLGRHIG
jgi:hypothetical protein